MLAQFASLMFKRAKQDAFVSLRLFPDKGGKGTQPIDIQPIQINDKDFLAIVVIRAEQAANWHEPAVFAPPVATFLDHKSAKTTNLCEGPCLSVECDERPCEGSKPCWARQRRWSKAAANGPTRRPAWSNQSFICIGG
jgi:hypothetical protein